MGTLWCFGLLFHPSHPTMASFQPPALPSPLLLKFRFYYPGKPSFHYPTVPRANISSPQWFPPPQGSLKLNCDTSFLKLGEDASIAGVIRDHSDSWVFGFLQNVLMGELLAICVGLQVIKARDGQR